ncbi:MAG: DUF3109 family protein [Bacteroidota bacterium]|nr:DUF3109 family protein [Bacteroidota bacterium]
MIQIDHTLISDDIVEARFECKLDSCKGACCVEGDSGAPLDENELGILDDIYPIVKKYMRKPGIEAIESIGKYTKDDDGDFVTPLVNNKECAYAVFTDDKTALCAIEKAYRAGEIEYKKPISCHLYPIRIEQHKINTAVNYHSWSICEAGRVLGDLKNIPLYKSAKEPLIRKFGQDWYDKLVYFAENYKGNLRGEGEK